MALSLAVGLAGCGASFNETGIASSAVEQKVGGAPFVTAGAASAAAVTGEIARPEIVKAANDITAASKPGNAAYKIGPLDVVEVSVFKVPDLSKTVQVADTGTINLPLVGEVPAAGRTAQEVERDLTQKLGTKYLQNPQVTVFIKEYNSQRVTVEGAVRKPGVYPIRGRSTLLQMIATAEGLTEVAESEVAIFREAGGRRSAAKFNIDDIRSGKSEDPPLQQGDTLVIGTSALAITYQNLMKAIPLGNFIAFL